MREDGEFMGYLFLDALLLHQEMLGFAHLAHLDQWRYILNLSIQNPFLASKFSLSYMTFKLIQTQIISDQTWKLIDGIWDKRIQEIREGVSMEVEEDTEKPQLLMADHFL